MKPIIDRIRKSWRVLVTSAFAILIFAVPASKGIFGKFFSASAGGNKNQKQNQQGGNQQGNSHSNSHSHTNSHSNSHSSHGSPESSPTASPMHPGDSASSDQRSRTGGGNRNRGSRRPNGR